MEKVLYQYKKKSLEKFNSYVIIDDLLATGGSIEYVANLIRKAERK